MKKIASPIALRSELASILEYAKTNHPSRAKLAADLQSLATRVASEESPIPEAVVEGLESLTPHWGPLVRSAKSGLVSALGNRIEYFLSGIADVLPALGLANEQEPLKRIAATIARRLHSMRPV